MKKTVSVLLLLVFVFNLGGYYFLFWVLKAKTNQELSIQLDEGDFDQSETIEIKIPITLPYPLQSNGFERQTGQFVYKQEHYQLVKQKYENDTLTVVCVRDIQTKRLTRAMDFFGEASTQQPLSDGSVNISMKIFQEYISDVSTFLEETTGWSKRIQLTSYFFDIRLVTLSEPSPPPWA